MTLAARIRRLHAERPDATAAELAEAVDSSENYVRVVACRYRLVLPDGALRSRRMSAERRAIVDLVMATAGPRPAEGPWTADVDAILTAIERGFVRVRP